MATLSKKDQISTAKKEYAAICRERVVKNGHIDEIEISDDQLEKILSDFETSLLSKNFETKSEFQDCIVQVAKEVLDKDGPAEEAAVSIDFANYLANSELVFN